MQTKTRLVDAVPRRIPLIYDVGQYYLVKLLNYGAGSHKWPSDALCHCSDIIRQRIYSSAYIKETLTGRLLVDVGILEKR